VDTERCVCVTYGGLWVGAAGEGEAGELAAPQAQELQESLTQAVLQLHRNRPQLLETYPAHSDFQSYESGRINISHISLPVADADLQCVGAEKIISGSGSDFSGNSGSGSRSGYRSNSGSGSKSNFLRNTK